MLLQGIDFFFSFLDYVNWALDKRDVYPKMNEWKDIKTFKSSS